MAVERRPLLQQGGVAVQTARSVGAGSAVAPASLVDAARAFREPRVLEQPRGARAQGREDLVGRDLGGECIIE